MKSIENWLVNLTGEQYPWVLELFVIVVLALSLGFVINRVIDKLEVQAAKTQTVWDDALIEACRRPLIWVVWILGINFAAGIAAQKMNSGLYGLVDPINRLALILLGVMFLTNFIKRAERNLVHPDYIAKPMDETTVRAVGKLLRAAGDYYRSINRHAAIWLQYFRSVGIWRYRRYRYGFCRQRSAGQFFWWA